MESQYEHKKLTGRGRCCGRDDAQRHGCGHSNVRIYPNVMVMEVVVVGPLTSHENKRIMLLAYVKLK